MKVLITLPVKIGFDGMTRQVLSYAQYMDRDGIEIDLLSCRGFDPKMMDQVEKAGFSHIYRLEYRDTKQFKYFLNLIRIMKKEHYDVIHANGQSATLAIEMLAGLLSGCKLRIAHSHNSNCLHLKAHRLLYPIFSMTYNDAIACSNDAGKWLFKDKPFWVLNNGINTGKFQFRKELREEYRKKLGLTDTDIALGNVAAFEPKKNHSFLVDIINELRKENQNYKLFLWGIDGSSKEKVLKKIDDLNLSDSVCYLGTTNEIECYLNAMDIMLLPSLFEGFPVTVVEWQANGLPCLVSDTITKDVNITGNVEFLPIDKGVEPWIDRINHCVEYEYDRISEKAVNALNSKGYDIRTNANELKKHYLQKIGLLKKEAAM